MPESSNTCISVCRRGRGRGKPAGRGESIYGPHFDDEDLTLRHSHPGVLSMANCGRNTNASQFIIATGPRFNLKHLDGTHVVFGGLVKGWNTLRALEAVTTGPHDCPLVPVVVADCGELPPGAADGVVEPPPGNPYMDHPEDQGVPELLEKLGAEGFYLSGGEGGPAFPRSLEAVMKAAEDLKGLGNQCFRDMDYQGGLQRYGQALRYLQWYDGADQPPAWREVMVQCYNNHAACHLKLGHLDLAVADCDKLLDLDSKNAKGFYRRASAYKAMNEPERCLKDVRRALQLQPSDTACKKLEREALDCLAGLPAASAKNGSPGAGGGPGSP
eukprot:EG_transcript_7243